MAHGFLLSYSGVQVYTCISIVARRVQVHVLVPEENVNPQSYQVAKFIKWNLSSQVIETDCKYRKMRARYGMAQVRQLASWNASSRLAPLPPLPVRSTIVHGQPLPSMTMTRRSKTIVAIPKVAVATFRPFSTLTGNKSGTSPNREDGDA
jgi:hypothetical protein